LTDIVIGINGYGPVLYLNNGTSSPFQNVPGLFVNTPPAPGTTGVGWGAAVMADVDNDGHPDIAIAGFNTPNMIYLNDGTSDAFNESSGFAIGTQDTAYVRLYTLSSANKCRIAFGASFTGKAAKLAPKSRGS